MKRQLEYSSVETQSILSQKVNVNQQDQIAGPYNSPFICLKHVQGIACLLTLKLTPFALGLFLTTLHSLGFEKNTFGNVVP